MKLLLDQNLSRKLTALLDPLFPGSSQAALLGLDRADDDAIWRFAAKDGYTIVTLDADFANLAALRGSPPKVVWLRCGNRPTAYIRDLLTEKASQLLIFDETANLDVLEIA